MQAEVAGGEPAERPWVAMATAHPWGLSWLLGGAAASAAQQPVSTRCLGGRAQLGGDAYTVGGPPTPTRNLACGGPCESICLQPHGTGEYSQKFQGLFQGQAELVSPAMVTLPSWALSLASLSLCVGIWNELRNLSRSPGRTCHCSSLLGSHCLQEVFLDTPLTGSSGFPCGRRMPRSRSTSVRGQLCHLGQASHPR